MIQTIALRSLRQAVADIEGNPCSLTGHAKPLALGIDAIDRMLGGGLACGVLHEVAPLTPLHMGTAAGYALALSARALDRRQILWIQSTSCEAGQLYGPGLALFGLPLQKLLLLKAACSADALWAMEEALKCRALAVVIAELPHDGSVDLTATRRLTLAANKGGGLGFLLRRRPSALTSAAETRWTVAAAPSRPDQFGGLGRTAFSLTLSKNRRGPTGHWIVTWDHHARNFSPLSFGVAQTAFDRPDRTPLARTG